MWKAYSNYYILYYSKCKILNAIFIVLFKLVVFNFTLLVSQISLIARICHLVNTLHFCLSEKFPSILANYIFLASNLEQNVNVPNQFVKTDPFIINNMRRLMHN